MPWAVPLLLAGCAAPLCRDCPDKDARVSKLEDRVRTLQYALEDYVARTHLRDRAPRVKAEGVITAYSPSHRVVILSVGEEYGVREDDVFWVHRDYKVVAKVRIERVERLWSSGRIVIQGREPRVDDPVTNEVADVDLNYESD